MRRPSWSREKARWPESARTRTQTRRVLLLFDALGSVMQMGASEVMETSADLPREVFGSVPGSVSPRSVKG